MPDTAIVLLNYNSLAYLKQFLPTLVKYTPDWATIYIIDNASMDDSVSFVKQAYPTIKWIQFEENYGFAGGYYHGLKEIEEEYWVLLNTDVEVTENWLSPLIDHLRSDKHLAAIQPKIKSHKRKNNFEHAGAAGGYIDFLGYPFCRGRLFDMEESDEGQYDEFVHCFWASGACMAVKKSAYLAAGEFDPRFFMHMEEIDMCWRMQRLGYTVGCEPKSVVYHVGGGTLAYESPKKFYYNFRNNLILLQKNLPIVQLVPTLVTRCVLDWVAAFRELLGGKPKKTLAVGQAWLSFLSNIFSWRGQYNHEEQAKAKGVYQKSILVDFFFLNHRKYSSLRRKKS